MGERRPHISLTIRVDGEEILCIETNCLSGVDDIFRYEAELREAADRLLGFLGLPPSPSPASPAVGRGG
jgi:hypothetical protein